MIGYEESHDVLRAQRRFEHCTNREHRPGIEIIHGRFMVPRTSDVDLSVMKP